MREAKVIRNVMFERFHVKLFVAKNISKKEAFVIRKTLDAPRFRSAWRRSIRGILGEFSALKQVRLRLSR
jgi:hypothetical protein